MNINIRKGRETDISDLFSLVKELAVYEKAPHEVVTTEHEYIQLFREDLFEFLVAEKEGKISGVALYFFTFSTWKGKVLFLEDFVVFPELRGQGIGSRLFEAVMQEAKSRDCAMMKWEVLDWNEDAIRFYEKYDVVLEKNWWDGKIFFKH